MNVFIQSHLFNIRKILVSWSYLWRFTETKQFITLNISLIFSGLNFGVDSNDHREPEESQAEQESFLQLLHDTEPEQQDGSECSSDSEISVDLQTHITRHTSQNRELPKTN